MGNDWFNTGFDGTHIDDAEKESRSGKTRRFFLIPDETKRIVLLDDEPFFIWEHSIRIGGKWRGNEYTCRKGMPDDPRCPLCHSDTNRYYIGFMTILDIDGFKDNQGNHHKMLRRLFPMKTETAKRFRKFKEQKTSLVGNVIQCTRSGKRVAAVGDIFDFVDKVDPFSDERFWYTSRVEGGQKKPPEVFDYRELLKPVSVKEMIALGNMESFGSGQSDYGDYSGSGGDDDAVY